MIFTLISDHAKKLKEDEIDKAIGYLKKERYFRYGRGVIKYLPTKTFMGVDYDKLARSIISKVDNRRNEINKSDLDLIINNLPELAGDTASFNTYVKTSSIIRNININDVLSSIDKAYKDSETIVHKNNRNDSAHITAIEFSKKGIFTTEKDRIIIYDENINRFVELNGTSIFGNNNIGKYDIDYNKFRVMENNNHLLAEITSKTINDFNEYYYNFPIMKKHEHNYIKIMDQVKGN